jgi:hypothetical protein
MRRDYPVWIPANPLKQPEKTNIFNHQSLYFKKYKIRCIYATVDTC